MTKVRIICIIRKCSLTWVLVEECLKNEGMVVSSMETNNDRLLLQRISEDNIIWRPLNPWDRYFSSCVNSVAFVTVYIHWLWKGCCCLLYISSKSLVPKNFPTSFCMAWHFEYG